MDYPVGYDAGLALADPATVQRLLRAFAEADMVEHDLRRGRGVVIDVRHLLHPDLARPVDQA